MDYFSHYLSHLPLIFDWSLFIIELHQVVRPSNARYLREHSFHEHQCSNKSWIFLPNLFIRQTTTGNSSTVRDQKSKSKVFCLKNGIQRKDMFIKCGFFIMFSICLLCVYCCIQICLRHLGFGMKKKTMRMISQP